MLELFAEDKWMHPLDASFFHRFLEEHAPIPHLPPSPSPPLDSGAHSITFKAVHWQLHSFPENQLESSA